MNISIDYFGGLISFDFLLFILSFIGTGVSNIMSNLVEATGGLIYMQLIIIAIWAIASIVALVLFIYLYIKKNYGKAFQMAIGVAICMSALFFEIGRIMGQISMM